MLMRLHVADTGSKELVVVDNLDSLPYIKALDVLQIQANPRQRFVMDVDKQLPTLWVKDHSYGGAAFPGTMCPAAEFVDGCVTEMRHEESPVKVSASEESWCI